MERFMASPHLSSHPTHTHSVQCPARRHRSVLKCLFAAVLCILPAHIAAAQDMPIERAPLSPDFIAWQEEMAQGGVPGGYVPPPIKLPPPKARGRISIASAVPTKYDLRALGWMTGVRSQGQCGDCWPFATYGSLESWLLKHKSERHDFSENHLKNYDGFDWDVCDGGNEWMSAAYLTRWDGPISETDDPYHDYNDLPSPGGAVQKYVTSVLRFRSYTDIKVAIMQYGALFAGMHFDEVRYYNPLYNTYYYSGTKEVDHSITVAGWDDNKYVPGAPDLGAWLVKNSHGADFGDQGYFYVSYYDANDVQEATAFCDAVPRSSYLNNYQYDDLGCIVAIPIEAQSFWIANAFRCKQDESLAAVGFYTLTEDMECEVIIYDENMLFSNQLARISTAQSYVGYHTVTLPTPVPLQKGDDFIVAVRYSSPDVNWPLAIECPMDGYSSQAKAGPGQSYLSMDGTFWIDLTTMEGFEQANVCIKALTVASDTQPADPNPMTWAIAPHATGTSTISMQATTASDVSVPVQYFFDFVSSPTGGTGGTDSAWQTGTTYTDTGLGPNHQYRYAVTCEDAKGNMTGPSVTKSAYTFIETPAGIQFGSAGITSIEARSRNTPSGLARGSSGLLIECRRGNATVGHSGWRENNSLWSATGLTPNTRYSFRAKARNGDAKETAYGADASRCTLARAPGAASFSSATPSSLRANWTANGNPAGTQYLCENISTGATSGWTTNTSWTDSGLACGTTYSYRIKARNHDAIATAWTSLGTGVTAACSCRLTVSSGTGGRVTRPGQGQFVYTCGSRVTLQAAPDNGYRFVNWSGTAVDAGKVLDPTAALTTLVVDADCIIRATFAPEGSHVVKLIASDAAPGDHFGTSVSISGDWAAVGAWGDDDGGANAGAVYIFQRSGATWIERTKLTALDSRANHGFSAGRGVSIAGGYLAVGALHDGDKGADAGAAYIFKQSGNAWVQQAKLTASDAAAGASFGAALSIRNEYLIVGAPKEHDPATEIGARGAAYIFKRSGTTWTQQAKVTASDRGELANFGQAVSISGDYAIVGNPWFHSSAAYIFERIGTKWTQQVKITGEFHGEGQGDLFGDSVGISGNSAAVGAPLARTDPGGDGHGCAYVFERAGQTWMQRARLSPLDSSSFGRSVAIDGDRAVSPGDLQNESKAALYVFRRIAGVWTQQARTTSSTAFRQGFGISVSVSGDYAIVGFNTDSSRGSNSGTAYIFTLP